MDLDLDKNGRPLPSERNWLTLLMQDEYLATVRKNVRSDLDEWTGKLPPWRTEAARGQDPTLRDDDYAEIRTRLALVYEFNAGATQNIQTRLSAIARRRAYDPVAEYVHSLPEWDGTERAETCLPGFPFDDVDARRCMHLALTGAVKRALNPGCEFDHMVVLVGPEGVGKTTSVARLFNNWVTTLGRFGHKDDEIRYSEAWCVMDDERVAQLGAGNRSGEQYKAWMTEREFRGRRAYGHTIERFPRAYVVWGATNDPNFLRSQAGNRRYLPIQLEASTAEQLVLLRDQDFIDQVWAEAKHWYDRGDRTYIDRDTELPDHERYLSSFLDEGDTDLMARLRAFLCTPVPAEWNNWSAARQVEWWQSHEEAGALAGEAAAVASAVEVPAAGDPPTRFVSAEGAGLVDRVFLKQLLALLEPSLSAQQAASVQMMLARELRQLGWVRKSIRVSGVVRKGYRPGPGWEQYVVEQKEAGLL